MLIITGAVMPNYKTPQRLVESGPKVKYAPYTISTFIVPPIDQGSPINLDFLSDKPGTTTLVLAPYSEEATIDLPTLLHVVFGPSQKGIVFFTIAPKSAQYILMVTSYNSSFQFRFDSVWSPFYQYRSATTLGILVLLLAVVSLYYFEHEEQKQRMFAKALSGLPVTDQA